MERFLITSLFWQLKGLQLVRFVSELQRPILVPLVSNHGLATTFAVRVLRCSTL